MKFLKDMFVFIANDIKRLKRKWISLPLLFMLPLLIIGGFFFLLSSFLSDEAEIDITIGLVNLDENDMTKTIVTSLSDESELTRGLTMEDMSFEDAEDKIENDKITAFIVFPENFAENMMNGHASNLRVTGNPKRQFESYMINSIVDTLIRHLRNSQSNILTLNHYAKEVSMDDEARHDMIFKEFVNQFIQVLGSDTLMKQEEKSQNFSAGYTYFILSSIFVLMTTWVFILHVTLMKDIPKGIKDRMTMLGVSILSEGISRVLVVFIGTLLPTILVLAISFYFIDIQITGDNIFRIFILVILHLIITATILKIMDWLSSTVQIRLLSQALVILAICLFSGSLIPRIYFPTYLDKLFEYSYSYQALTWLEGIVLNGRFTMEVDILVISLILTFIFMVIIAYFKERRLT